MSNAVDQLRLTIARLRAPGGCPWDREQTSASLSPSLIEEAYEVADAIGRNHAADLEEELGDLLINILMQAEIASEGNAFTLESIATTASEKLIRRHPHVFGDSAAGTSEAVLIQWDEIKKAERAAKAVKEGAAAPAKESLLDGVARAFPALVRAQKIQKKAAKAGFDWECPEDVIDKVHEEIAEVRTEMAQMASGDLSGTKARLTEEVGDLLFAAVNLARALGVDAESSLHAATSKFEERFRDMELRVSGGKSFPDLTLEEMNALWEQAKQAGKAR